MILEGSGTLELWPSPEAAPRLERETHEIRAGHVISRPPSTGISHFLRAGDEAMTFLAYGTRSRTMFATTPGRTRSSGAASASSPGWNRSATTTESPRTRLSLRRTQPNCATRTQPRRGTQSGHAPGFTQVVPHSDIQPPSRVPDISPHGESSTTRRLAQSPHWCERRLHDRRSCRGRSDGHAFRAFRLAARKCGPGPGERRRDPFPVRLRLQGLGLAAALHRG